MHLPVHYADDCGASVKAGRYGAASGLDGRYSGGGGARDDDVNGLFEGALSATAEELHAFFGLMDAAGLSEFADGDGAGWVDAALVDPFLDAVEVCGGQFGGEAVDIINKSESKNQRIKRGKTNMFVNPRSPWTTISGVCPPLNPVGTFPCCF